MHSVRILRALTISGQGICLPYRFCKVLLIFLLYVPAQDKTVVMLYGLGNTSSISPTGLYGERYGPVCTIGPNILA